MVCAHGVSALCRNVRTYRGCLIFARWSSLGGALSLLAQLKIKESILTIPHGALISENLTEDTNHDYQVTRPQLPVARFWSCREYRNSSRRQLPRLCPATHSHHRHRRLFCYCRSGRLCPWLCVRASFTSDR